MRERQANPLLRHGYCTNQYWDLHALVDTNPGNETQEILSQDLIRDSLSLSTDAVFVSSSSRAQAQPNINSTGTSALTKKKNITGKKNFCGLTTMAAIIGFL